MTASNSTAVSPQAVVMGASAGALEALSLILPELASGFALPIVIVVHLPPHRESMLAELLAAKCQIKVVEAEDKEALQPGTVYVAPPDYHVLMESDLSISLSIEEEVLFSRPSINVLFESAADAFGPDVIGIVLSGANEDGAQGLQAIADSGGITIVQAPETASSATMPRAALQRCPDALVLTPTAIARYLGNYQR